MNVYHQASKIVRHESGTPLILTLAKLDDAIALMRQADPGLTVGWIGGVRQGLRCDVVIAGLEALLWGSSKAHDGERVTFTHVLIDTEVPPVVQPVVIVT